MNVFLQRERERQIVEIVKWFLMVVILHRDVHEKYKNGTLKFDDVQKLVDDKGESVLYNLKEACHKLFRHDANSPNNNLGKENLFDLAIGSFFHEAMKVREDCYQLEFYSPHDMIELEMEHANTDYEKDFLNRILKLTARVEERLPKEFEEIDALLSDTINQFKALMQEHCGSGLLVRFMIENRQLINQVFGPKGLKELFQLMYKEGSVEAYSLAAKSYFESGFYDKAAITIKKIQRSKKDDKGLQLLYYYYIGVREYYAENYQQSLENLTNAEGLGETASVNEGDLQKIKCICNKVKLALRGIEEQGAVVSK
jgi:tetratricopeptide (TPR) repeat protein